MDIKLIASDLDGTIIDCNNNINKKNYEAIKKIHEKNIPFVICTGKSYSVSKKLCDDFNADFGIFGNGTQIIDLKHNKEILKKILSKEDLLFIATFAKRNNYHIHLYTDTELISEKLEYMDLRNFKLKSQNNLKFKIVKDLISFIETNDLKCISIIISTSSSSLKDFQKTLSINPNINCNFINKRGEYRDNIIKKDYEYLIISPSKINKDIALRFLAKLLHIDSKQILAIGDNVNDLEMIKNCGIGVAVLDSYEDIKQVANYITTTSVSNGAFAEAIYKFI